MKTRVELIVNNGKVDNIKFERGLKNLIQGYSNYVRCESIRAERELVDGSWDFNVSFECYGQVKTFEVIEDIIKYSNNLTIIVKVEDVRVYDYI